MMRVEGWRQVVRARMFEALQTLIEVHGVETQWRLIS